MTKSDTSNVRDLLAERGKSYGNFTDGLAAEEAIMKELEFVHFQKSGLKMLPGVWIRMHRIVLKLVRIAADPTHEDSWSDISGYATLVQDELNNGDYDATE